jgi:hypothetical protein
VAGPHRARRGDARPALALDLVESALGRLQPLLPARAGGTASDQAGGLETPVQPFRSISSNARLAACSHCSLRGGTASSQAEDWREKPVRTQGASAPATAAKVCVLHLLRFLL